jgi:hypothetical protein
MVGNYFGAICGYCVVGSDYIHFAYMWIAGIKACVEPSSNSLNVCTDYELCESNFSNRKLIFKLIVGLGLFMLETLISNIKVLNTISTFSLLVVGITVVCVVMRVW